MMVGKLVSVNLRDVWANEAKDFTKWLGENLDMLSEHIGIKQLSLLETEKSVGTLSADIFAEGDGETVVIENQLQKTDHDHLGKILTYLSNLDAKTAIWITTQPRPEHVTAINWLNQISPSDTSFFLVRVDAYKIGDSQPAPLFTTVSGPSIEAKQIGRQKGELAERHVNRLEFWGGLLEKAASKTKLYSGVAPSKDNWLYTGAGKSGLWWSFIITMDHGMVQLCINLGPDKKDETDKIFEQIRSHQEEIEKVFGEKLSWIKRKEILVCRIESFSQLGGLRDEEKWEQIQEDMIDRMVRLEKALKPSLAKIRG